MISSFVRNQIAKEQPDLNFRNEHLRNEMKEVLKFWLKKGAAGFRIDATPHLFEVEDLRDEPLSELTDDKNSYDYTLHHYTRDLPEVYDLIYEFREIADEHWHSNGNGDQPILMTEAYTNVTEYLKYFKSSDGKRLGAQLPFNFVLISDVGKKSTATDFKRIIDERIAAVPSGTRLNWVIGNHDNPRIGSRFGEQRIDGLLTLVMTLPSIAITYYVNKSQSIF